MKYTDKPGPVMSEAERALVIEEAEWLIRHLTTLLEGLRTEDEEASTDER